MRITLRCKQHPRYEAKREPRGQCDRCWLIWLAHCVATLRRREQERVRSMMDDFW